MPYQPVILGSHVPPRLTDFVRQHIDAYLSDFRFLILVQRPDQGPKGSLQIQLAILLLVAVDGAAKFLHPGTGKHMKVGDRFIGFLKANCPWELDPPDGLTVDEACEYLWKRARCPLAHAYGLSLGQGPGRKIGRKFSSDDEALTRLELLTDDRPYTQAMIRRNAERTSIWIEPLYWALRVAIQRSLSTPEKAAQVDQWIASGEWDR